MKLIIVEGKDEINFFNSLLKFLGLPDVVVLDAKGKDRFNTEIPTILRSSQFADQLTHLAVVADADGNAEAAFHKVKDILKSEGYEIPNRKNTFRYSTSESSVGIYIMPGDFDKGMLEDLCLSMAKDQLRMELANEYMEKVMLLVDPPKNLAKAKALAYLVTMPDLVTSVGLAAQKNYWDFDCKAVEDLKSFLNNFQ